MVDNLEVSSFIEPVLTTVDQNIGSLMETTADELIQWMENGKVPPRQVFLETGLRVRQSHHLI